MKPTANGKRFEGFERRMGWLLVAVVAFSALLCARLWQLQIVDGQVYTKQAEDNRLDYEVIKSPRGIIYGRDETIVLADNRAALDLVLTPALLRDAEGVCAQLGNLVDVDSAALIASVERAIKRKTPFEQILVKQDITKTERMRVEEYSFALQGVYTVARPLRRYYHNHAAGQILGWINEIDREMLDRNKPRYKLGDIIGRDGIEQRYESDLKGTDGAMIVTRYNGSVPQLRTDVHGMPYIEVDSKGRSLALERRQDAVPGKPIFTSLDIELQIECERILRDELLAEDIVDIQAEGAIVVMDVDTGELLALASVPTYDPNIFTTQSPDQQTIIDSVMKDPRKPMLHRAFQTHYPPGSVFKVLLAVAALEEGAIDEHTTFSCGGSFRYSNHTWRCWRPGGHGGVSIVDALAFSCDVFFYNAGLRLGPEKLNKWAHLLGQGETTGIDLPREVPGGIPSPDKKAAAAKRRKSTNRDDFKWYPGDTINMSIGQGMVDATILQNAVMMASVLNGGKRVRPFVNMALGPDVSEQLIGDNTLRIVSAGLLKCVEKKQPPSGTGREARIEGLTILGKTGTAQVAHMSQLKGRRERNVPYELRDHALFVAGVTNMKPRIAVSIIVEHGLHGSTTAAPVAKKVFDYFYLKRKQSGEPGAAPEAVNVAMHGEPVE
ncbi:MAG: penicillin-binding protein 2 [Candidatus Hydrogenedentes bacterium]|nr:penicillin-binding protein 2 [Candidatus Hydrogenedentota bacterium]